MKNHELGRLEKVALREIWNSEAADFTPWLAREDNLKLLGDTIGLDLELEAQEKDVGPFRADILCKDTATGNWVLIENQLEKTDHTHLGQLMTYGAGLKAVTIVWVSSRFTDEHRAALDWLNNITNKEINFFGLEIELWRIGESPVAPKFNMVSMPNDWSKSIGTDGGFDIDKLSDTKKLQLNFWIGLKEYMRDRSSGIKSQKPYPQHWTNFAIGRSYFHLSATINTREHKLSCILVMSGDDAMAHFCLLRNDKNEIESEFGRSLEWREMPERNEKHITVSMEDNDITDQERWPDYYEWLADTLETYHKVFANRIKQLDASGYEPPDEEDDDVVDQ